MIHYLPCNLAALAGARRVGSGMAKAGAALAKAEMRLARFRQAHPGLG